MMSCDDYEANWNGQTDRQEDGQGHVLSQADSLTKNFRKVNVSRHSFQIPSLIPG